VITEDCPAPGLRVTQPARGFRYGSEAFWVAGCALELGPARDALDLGTGSGIVALLLGQAGLDVRGVDIRPEWGPLWARTQARSVCAGRVVLERVDVREVRGSVDLVVSNPPFFPRGSGPVATDPWRAAARTEDTATLADFVAAAVRCLRPGGRAVFVVPRGREHEVRAHGAAAGVGCVRCVRVGRRRTVLALGPGSDAVAEQVPENGALAQAWRARVARAVAAPYRGA